MNQHEKPTAYEDEINLYDYWKVIVKRKRLIIGLFLVSIISVAAISFLMPEIYRGEVILKLPAKELTAKKLTAKELITIIGKPDRERIKTILPKTQPFISNIDLNELRGSTDRLQVFIESKNPDKIPAITQELVEHINNNPLVKRYVEQGHEKLLRQSEELSRVIEAGKELKNNFNKMLATGRLTIVGFNPIDLEKGLSDLKIEKLTIEQEIKNLKGIEIISQHISNKPVKPKKLQMVVISGVLSLFAGIFIAFFAEYINKIKNRQNS